MLACSDLGRHVKGRVDSKSKFNLNLAPNPFSLLDGFRILALSRLS